MRVDGLQARHAIHRIARQMEPIELIQHGHIERRGGRAFFFVSVHMEIAVIFAAIRQPVNQGRVAVVRKNHGLVGGEHRIEFAVRQVRADAQPCVCSVIRSTTFTTRILMSGKCCRSKSTAASVSSVGMSPAQAITTSGSHALVRARPIPNSHSRRAMLDRRFHVEILQCRLLACNDHVHVVAAA